MAALLRASGVDVDIVDFYGHTALMGVGRSRTFSLQHSLLVHERAAFPRFLFRGNSNFESIFGEEMGRFAHRQPEMACGGVLSYCWKAEPTPKSGPISKSLAQAATTRALWKELTQRSTLPRNLASGSFVCLFVDRVLS
jgi:hypothetical protein